MNNYHRDYHHGSILGSSLIQIKANKAFKMHGCNHETGRRSAIWYLAFSFPEPSVSFGHVVGETGGSARDVVKKTRSPGNEDGYL